MFWGTSLTEALSFRNRKRGGSSTTSDKTQSNNAKRPSAKPDIGAEPTIGMKKCTEHTTAPSKCRPSTPNEQKPGVNRGVSSGGAAAPTLLPTAARRSRGGSSIGKVVENPFTALGRHIKATASQVSSRLESSLKSIPIAVAVRPVGGVLPTNGLGADGRRRSLHRRRRGRAASRRAEIFVARLADSQVDDYLDRLEAGVGFEWAERVGTQQIQRNAIWQRTEEHVQAVESVARRADVSLRMARAANEGIFTLRKALEPCLTDTVEMERQVAVVVEPSRICVRDASSLDHDREQPQPERPKRSRSRQGLALQSLSLLQIQADMAVATQELSMLLVAVEDLEERANDAVIICSTLSFLARPPTLPSIRSSASFLSPTFLISIRPLFLFISSVSFFSSSLLHPLAVSSLQSPDGGLFLPSISLLSPVSLMQPSAFFFVPLFLQLNPIDYPLSFNVPPFRALSLLPHFLPSPRLSSHLPPRLPLRLGRVPVCTGCLLSIQAYALLCLLVIVGGSYRYLSPYSGIPR